MGNRDEKLMPGYKWVFTPYITVNGIRRYKKDGGLFKFQVPETKEPPKDEKKPKDV
jgi:hypothetical protein